ncbi:F-box protein At5g07610-like [Rhododendron vialii]|uniref:F-box protein At5g07610-like n=1 Tax=Rhododendron vialii TaxID=182163 RepID=UPI00265FD961|nr:F-box protein At5g07610-like [Rhododendron vialii]
MPAKSLIKFQCVSNHWLSLISDSNFAINHTRRNPTPLVSGIYVHSHWCHTPPLNDQVLPVSVAGHCRNSLPTFSFLDRALSTSTATVTVTDSSNGLMLCCDGDGNYIVCNLTTQKFIQLPKPNDIISEWWSQYYPYLVFDPTKSPHYKVVLHSNSDYPNASRLAIYTSECASWKYVDLVPSIDSGRSAILNGAIIWMSCKDWKGNCSRHEHVYSRLDVDAEKLAVTRVSSDPNLSKYTLYFGECGGRLLLIQLPTHDATEFSILEMDTDAFCWILKDRVDFTSLILPYKSSCVISVISIVKGTKENDLAVVFYNRGKVISCNLECRTMNVICELSPDEITSFARRGLYEYSTQFIESLSPV